MKPWQAVIVACLILTAVLAAVAVALSQYFTAGLIVAGGTGAAAVDGVLFWLLERALPL